MKCVMCSKVTINTVEPIAVMFALSKEISTRGFYSCVVQPLVGHVFC